VVIDESLDIIDEVQVQSFPLRQLIGSLPDAVVIDHADSYKALKQVSELLEEAPIVNGVPLAAKTAILRPGHPLLNVVVDFGPIRQAIHGTRFDLLLAKREDLLWNRNKQAQFDSILSSVEALLNQWRYYERTQKSHTLNTARLILPEEIKGAVVLDATAAVDLVYRGKSV